MKSTNKFVALLLCGLAWAFCSGSAAAEEKKKPKTAEELYETLDPFYKQKVIVNGFLIVGSEKLSPYAMKEAAYLLEKMLKKRPDVLAKLVERHDGCGRRAPLAAALRDRTPQGEGARQDPARAMVAILIWRVGIHLPIAVELPRRR